jgi:hypothetical protein
LKPEWWNAPLFQEKVPGKRKPVIRDDDTFVCAGMEQYTDLTE